MASAAKINRICWAEFCWIHNKLIAVWSLVSLCGIQDNMLQSRSMARFAAQARYGVIRTKLIFRVDAVK